MADSVYVVSGSPDQSAANPVSPTLADAITAAVVAMTNAAASAVAAASSTTAAALSAAQALSAQTAIASMEAVVVADLAQVQADIASAANTLASIQAISTQIIGDLGLAQNTAASAAAAATTALNAANTTASAAAASSASAAAAAASAAGAAAAVQNLIYPPYAGPDDPLHRPDSSAPQIGDRYYNIAQQVDRILLASGWQTVAATLAAIPSTAIIPTDSGDFSVSISLAATDNSAWKSCTAASGVTVTLPNNMTKGFNCMIHQGGAGQVTFSPATNATLNNRLGQYRTAGLYAIVAVLCTANSDGSHAVYTLSGDTIT